MAEFIAYVWAGLVVGLPISYVTWGALKQRRLLVLLMTFAGLLLILFSPQTLVVTWLLLSVVMALCLAIFAFYTCLTVRLLFVPRKKNNLVAGGVFPKIAVLIPARNEARVIMGCLDSLLRSAYPADRLDIVVIDDGSVDDTIHLVASYRELHSNVRLLVRSPSAMRGKAAALNEAIAQVDAEFVCILDADHQVAEHFFQTALPNFQDSQVGGVQARKIGRNRCENLLTRLIELELQGWQYCFLDSKSQSHLIPVSFGTGCMFRTELLRHLGGFNNDLATEDLELSLRMYKAGYKVLFEPGTYTTDELVSNWRSFFHQRYRWARGTTQAIPLHWRSAHPVESPSVRERLDFYFYSVLLCMMIVPYLQIAGHALAMAGKVDLPLTSFVALSYISVIFFCYLTAGFRNRRENAKENAEGALNLLLLAVGMCFYYASLFLVVNLKAFLDEFVLRIPYRPVKAEHRGFITVLSRDRHGAIALDQQLVLDFGRYVPRPEKIMAVRSRLPQVNWKRVDELARFHGVAALIHANLVQYGMESAIPPSVRQSWLASRRAVLARNLYLQQSWREIAQTFSKADIESIPLKGIRFIDGSCPLDVRPMHDIDLLVKAAQVKEASRQLETLGYRPVPNLALNHSAWWTQRPFRHPSTDVVIDLHWDLINIYSYRQIYAVSVEEIWARAKPMDGNRMLYEMAPEDLLLHSALHCAMHHHFVTLSQLVDLGEILRTSCHRLDWKRLINLAGKYRIKSPMYLALMLSRRLMDAEVPDLVLNALQPPLYRRLCFQCYIPRNGTTLNSRMPSRLIRDLKWFWGSVVMADSFVDSLRAARSNVVFVFGEFAEILRDTSRRTLRPQSEG